MSMLLALALTQIVVPITPVPGTVADGRRPLSLWIGADDRLSFAFGRAISRSLAVSPTVRQANPIAAAEYRLVLRRLHLPKTEARRFAYTIDLLQPRTRGRERTVNTISGSCTAATLDACATEATARIAKRLKA